ncbi:hypothetical protein ACTXT7_003466 [Hymenolepis weldensis]
MHAMLKAGLCFLFKAKVPQLEFSSEFPMTFPPWELDDYLTDEREIVANNHAPGKGQEQKSKSKRMLSAREALKPVRVFSFNHNVPIINLSDTTNTQIFYVSGHLGVIYDVKKNEQYILRGHVNTITSISASRSRRWLATGDAGPESAVMIWDAQTKKVVRCLFGIHPGGVIALRLTPDARYLASLSAPLRNDSGQQTLSIWNWTSGPYETENDEVSNESSERPQPLCSVQIKAGDVGIQTQITFKEDSYFQIMSNSESHVIFYDWTLEGSITSHTPSFDAAIFRINYGMFVMSAFVPNTDMAITPRTRKKDKAHYKRLYHEVPRNRL